MPGRHVFDTFDEVAFSDRDGWRAWLSAHHGASSGVWLVYRKKGSGLPSVTYAEAVEEALCFGWIDSRVNSIDERSYKQVFTPRRTGSIWSLPNKQRVERMISEGRMTEAGMAVVRRSQADGSWSVLDQVDALVLPAELESALDADPDARAGFDRLADSQKKQVIYWLLAAKRPSTRATRVERVTEAAREGRTPFG
ncbi:MAG: YdeI/OmpD-associated family protein [Acidimicrobiia bacterium]|jgi:uncharacterized protein YdeI (YjbR/CyaY-like superfamily)